MATAIRKSTEIDDKVCPLCNANGSEQNGILTLRQINAKEAIYVCENPNCIYPVGEEVKIIHRVLELSNNDMHDGAKKQGICVIMCEEH